MLDIRKLKELVRLMVANDLSEIDLRDNEEQVTLRRHGPDQAPQIVTAPAAASATPSDAATAPEQSAAEQGLVAIVTPMVGICDAADNPDSPWFITVGATVGPDTVVCMIEAMKIFNEIKAEHSGTIEKILVSNSESVEFGQSLFLLSPS